jgi:multiple sugar transport system substrate-binding protein
VLGLEPLGIYDWMSGEAEAPAYSPLGYGYTNYSREGFRPFRLSFTTRPESGRTIRAARCWAARGSPCRPLRRRPRIAVDYAFWIAGAECQKGLYTASGGQPGHAAAWDDDACNA